MVNAPVEALIDHFVAKDRERFGMWISRSGRYLPMIQRIFREKGLPEELAYTAMIESGFSPRAVSRVGAKGMWQFMEATARRYGLVINRWVDERLDPVKSTIAAAEYLGDLYGLFGHWFLAQAGYNAGEARVGRAIQRARTSDFWALTQTRHLPDETKMFVPQILAAAVITQAPSRYGFDVTLAAPLAYDEVVASAVAGPRHDRASGGRLRGGDPRPESVAARPDHASVRELRAPAAARRGPAVRRGAPGRGAVEPPDLAGAPDRAQPVPAEIARLYRVTTQRLAELNHLPGGRLRGIRELVVPGTSAPAVATSAAVRAGAPEPRARWSSAEGTRSRRSRPATASRRRRSPSSTAWTSTTRWRSALGSA